MSIFVLARAQGDADRVRIHDGAPLAPDAGDGGAVTLSDVSAQHPEAAAFRDDDPVPRLDQRSDRCLEARPARSGYRKRVQVLGLEHDS
jgi:hypothetical protein